MYIFKNKWSLLLLNLIITASSYLYYTPGNQLKEFINTLFFVSFPYIILALILFLTRERFFDGITFGFRRFWAEMSKKKDYLEDWKDRPLPSERISQRFLRSISFQAISLLIIMMVLLIIYYL
ncbi:DUF3899 domain-containing protein [Salinibacillus kushneri]|uniref:DUF3899 domain-containing protein n=1 Tax=Salinibacillus kushneri TaxID=237682 RepID=UPI000B89122A|nr:DUF3899 domain-containing protein [Salinibacillus kushneri]